jgi:hypothetical protein
MLIGMCRAFLIRNRESLLLGEIVMFCGEQQDLLLSARKSFNSVRLE